MPDELDALLLAVANGDSQAYEDFYRHMIGPVLDTCRYLVRDPDHAQDVAHEAMLEVWRSARNFDPSSGTARTWTLLIARRRTIDLIRSLTAAGHRATRYAASEWLPPYDDVVDLVVLRSEHAEVREALAALKPRQHSAVELVYYRGYTLQEAATELGWPLGTVKTTTRAAIRTLREQLDNINRPHN
jgi:RNA polymerase sigma-70 factor (ECF subfamily)